MDSDAPEVVEVVRTDPSPPVFLSNRVGITPNRLLLDGL